MKKITFAVAFLALAGWAGAQQVRLLEEEPATEPKKEAAEPSGMPQILMPLEDTPTADVKKQAAPAVKKSVKPAAKKTVVKPAAPAAVSSTAPVKSAAVIPPVPAGAPAKAALPAVQPVPAVKASPVPVKAVSAAVVPAIKASSAPVQAAPVPAAKTTSKWKQTLAAVKTSSAPVKIPAAEVKPAAVPAPAAPVQEAKSEGGFSVNKKHTVSGGDTLWDLSGKYYQDPYKWGKIYNANLATVVNPDRIYPREELIIPDITEEVKPEFKKAVEITGGDTVKDAEFSSSDIAQAEQSAALQAKPASAAPAAARSGLGDGLDKYELSDLSQNMPEHQKEWARGVKIVPENWRPDGVVKAKNGGSGAMDDSLSMSGEVIVLSMAGEGLVMPGDYLKVYLKGAVALDKDGRSRGLELQSAGMLEVISVDGSSAKARVIDSVTPISKGYVVSKK